MRHSISQPQNITHILRTGQGHQLVHRHHGMMQTHQSGKATQLRLLEIVKFPIKSGASAAASLLPLVTSVVMQCKRVVMQLEAKEQNDAGIKRR
jgi:hypothetical protein